jgi:8-oxo-dGTP diphosphatase
MKFPFNRKKNAPEHGKSIDKAVVNNALALFCSGRRLRNMKTVDVKAQIRKEVAGIVPFDDLEREHQADVLRWIDSGANIFRISKPDKPPKHLVSYFAVIDPDHDSLLLGEHTKAGKWLPTGGHVEFNELPSATVFREAKEELGIKPVFLKGNDHPFFVTVTEVVDAEIRHTDVSLWFLLRGHQHDTHDFDRIEFRNLAWFGFEEILQSHPSIFDPHMQRFTRKLVRFLGRNATSQKLPAPK